MYDKTPETAQNIINQPETADAALFAEMARHKMPSCLPHMIPEAVREWKSLNEPYDMIRETPRLVTVQGKEKENAQRWACPYNERLIYTFRKFVEMSPKDQKTVLHGIRAMNVPWRGDEIDFYTTVVNETMIMREIGVEDYRKQARGKARSVIEGAKPKYSNCKAKPPADASLKPYIPTSRRGKT